MAETGNPEVVGSATRPATRTAPPMDVVLATPYYAILVAEAIGLVLLHLYRPEESGGEHYSGWLGYAGTISMIVMHVYSLRRRIRALHGWGPLRAWLQFHIFMGLQGALLVAYHGSHLSTLINLSGVNIALVGIVVVSGIFGRYLYALVPKNLAGERLSARQVEDELAALGDRIQAGAPTPELATAIAGFSTGTALAGRPSLSQIVSEDLRARRALRELDVALKQATGTLIQTSRESLAQLEQFVATARRRVFLSRRLATLTAAESLFRNWTIFHKPLTFLLLASTVLHVLGHFLYGGMYSG